MHSKEGATANGTRKLPFPARSGRAFIVPTRGFLASSQLNGRYTGPRRAPRSFSPYTRCSSPDIPNSAAWREAARGTARSAKMVAALRAMERERYWLDFALWAQDSNRG